MEDQLRNQLNVSRDEIDIVEIARQLWIGRKIILLSICSSVIIAGIYIVIKQLTLTPEYESKVTIYIDGSTGTTMPVMLNGTPFLAGMLDAELSNPSSGSVITVKDALEKLTKPPQGSLSSLKSRVKVAQAENGTFIVTVMMQDQDLANQLADSVSGRLIQWFTEFQQKRSISDQEYLHTLCREAETKYQKAMKSLETYYDLHSRSKGGMDTLTVKQLRADCELKFDIFRDLSVQVEKAKIKDQEDKPVINVLEPASAAIRSNSVNFWKPITITMILGFIAGAVYVLLRNRKADSGLLSDPLS